MNSSPLSLSFSRCLTLVIFGHSLRWEAVESQIYFNSDNQNDHETKITEGNRAKERRSARETINDRMSSEGRTKFE